jgi:hypothetical protein
MKQAKIEFLIQRAMWDLGDGEPVSIMDVSRYLSKNKDFLKLTGINNPTFKCFEDIRNLVRDFMTKSGRVEKVG